VHHGVMQISYDRSSADVRSLILRPTVDMKPSRRLCKAGM
jgi:hypothetical protein